MPQYYAVMQLKVMMMLVTFYLAFVTKTIYRAKTGKNTNC